MVQLQLLLVPAMITFTPFIFLMFHFTVYNLLILFLQPNLNPDLFAPEDKVVVHAKLMDKKQADIIRQQLEHKPPDEDVQIISTRSFQTSVTVIPPGIHSDREVTIFKVEGTDITIVLEYDNDHF